MRTHLFIIPDSCGFNREEKVCTTSSVGVFLDRVASDVGVGLHVRGWRECCELVSHRFGHLEEWLALGDTTATGTATEEHFWLALNNTGCGDTGGRAEGPDNRFVAFGRGEGTQVGRALGTRETSLCRRILMTKMTMLITHWIGYW